MKIKNKYVEVIHDRLSELNLAKLPTQVVEHLEAELHEDFTRLVQRRLTTNHIVAAIPKVLRQRKAAAQPAPDAASTTLANG
jgi:hypothetical protein